MPFVRKLLVAPAFIIGLVNMQATQRYITEEVSSKFFAQPRTVRIYLPASYEGSAERKFPVLYLHDGQNVFSFAGANVGFGWGSWELDKTADALSRNGKLPEIIMVAVDNSGLGRYAEYCGAHRPEGATTNTPFENYAAFLIQELKPRIDKNYRTHSEPAQAGVMGSSMGGICSVVLAWEHPEVFGSAASLSGAFTVEKTNFLQNVLKPCSSKSGKARIYLDSGVCDFMGGDDGRSLTEAVAGEFRRLGWGDELLHYTDLKPLSEEALGKSGLRRDKWEEAQRSQHNEFYWRLRAWRPLTFLFPPEPK
jgi:predicted alpha/beta superfamily hydrolase